MTSILLAVDTATAQCGVSLIVDGKVCDALCSNHGQTHSRHVLDAVDTVLSRSRATLASVDAFAVTRGPGSFTGLRIGISTVKGLAFATGKPIVGISSLQVLAHQADAGSKLVCPMIDARRKEIYWALYQRSESILVPQTGEHVGPLERLVGRFEGECLFIGSGALLYSDRLSQLFGKHARLASGAEHVIHPSVLAQLAWKRFQKGQYLDADRFLPVYLRKSDAELNRSGSG